nr:xylulose kinase-1 [Tanacetum cinerariifolium]
VEVDCFPKVLKFKKSIHPSSGSTTPISDSSPSLIPFETSDSLLEEFTDELSLLDAIPPGKEDNNFDFEADLREIKYLLNQDPSTESNIETINPILEKFTNEAALDCLPPPGDDDDDDDLFDLKSNNDEWKKLLNGDFYKDIDSKKDKNKDSKKKLFVEAHFVESNDLLPQLLTSDSTFPRESSESFEIATLSSSLFGNKDKVFKPGILILRGTHIFDDESKDLNDTNLILEDCNVLPSFSDQELLVHLELTVIKTLLSLSSENKHKVFNPGILILKDYPIWQVIENGNGLVSVITDTNRMIKVLPPKTAEEVVAREKDRKARTTLLMALPEDHLAKSHKIANAKEMWEAIKSRFGGNDESKKMQKYLLK